MTSCDDIGNTPHERHWDMSDIYHTKFPSGSLLKRVYLTLKKYEKPWFNLTCTPCDNRIWSFREIDIGAAALGSDCGTAERYKGHDLLTLICDMIWFDRNKSCQKGVSYQAGMGQDMWSISKSPNPVWPCSFAAVHVFQCPPGTLIRPTYMLINIDILNYTDVYIQILQGEAP